MTPSEYFQSRKYVKIDAALEEDICAFLADHLHKLVDQKKTYKDDQCPISEAVYGDPLFDTLMEDLRPKMEEATGLRLLPTYSYARKYLPGEELVPHLDRPSCEVSATLTLGYKGDVWPIYLSRDSTVENEIGSVDLKIGDLLIYRGTELNHWRKPYTEGEWQCQVFVHYVDADGPHKDLEYDKRDSKFISAQKHKKTEAEARSKDIPREYWYFGLKQDNKFLFITRDNVLTDGTIQTLSSYARDKLEAARVGVNGEGGKVDLEIRNATNCFIEFQKFDWLYSDLEKLICDVNWYNFKFVLDRIEPLNYIEYHAGVGDEVDEHGHGKYVKHVDNSFNGTRKLSFSILLSDPEEFEGGDLMIWDSPTPLIVPKQKRRACFFPSTMMHEVTPVTKGIRRSLVGWVHGPHLI